MPIEIHQTYSTKIRPGDWLPTDTIDRIRHDDYGVPVRVETNRCARVAAVGNRTAITRGVDGYEQVTLVLDGGAVLEARPDRKIVVVRETAPGT
jgi:hypothetical protein